MSVNNTTFLYNIFGIQISSDIEFPLLTQLNNGPVQLTICYVSTIKEAQYSFSNAFFSCNADEMLVKLPHDSKILIRNANLIQYNTKSPEVSVFLLGSAMAAALLQNKVFLLHATSLVYRNKAFSISGISGAGKSTLAAYLNKKGIPILADDVTALNNKKGIPLVLPGIPIFKLWRDALKLLSINEELPRVRAELEKFYYSTNEKYDQTATLSTIFILNSKNANEFVLREISGTEKFNLLRKHSYRYQYIEPMGLSQWHFNECIRLSATTRVIKITRPRHNEDIEKLANMVLQQLVNSEH